MNVLLAACAFGLHRCSTNCRFFCVKSGTFGRFLCLINRVGSDIAPFVDLKVKTPILRVLGQQVR